MRPMPRFSLHRPTALKEALQMLNELPYARPMAGGTDLLLFLRDGVITAEHLIDLGEIEELNYIRQDGEEIRIGATTTLSQVHGSSLIRERAPALAKAAGCVGSPQIRNRGTLGGNLCNASPAADTAPPLLILDARAEILSTEGPRSIHLVELFAGPKQNSLKQGELLKEISFITPHKGSGTSFQKLGRRKGYTLSVVNAAAYIKLDGDRCQEARLALGAVASTPVRLGAAEKILKGTRITRELLEKVATACREMVSPIDDIRGSAEYRCEMSRVLVRRTLVDALEAARRSRA